MIAVIPLILFGLISYEYGAFLLYIIPALLCLVQYFFPTIFLWGLFFTIFAAGSAIYSFLIISDIYKLIIGVYPSLLLDVNDSAAFILLLAILVGITFVLFTSRPRLSLTNGKSKEVDMKET